jgi:hypothetical protein
MFLGYEVRITTTTVWKGRVGLTFPRKSSAINVSETQWEDSGNTRVKTVLQMEYTQFPKAFLETLHTSFIGSDVHLLQI